MAVKKLENLADSSGTLLVEFGAAWCAPCKVLLPILERLSEQYPTLPVYQVDISESLDLARSQRISSVPCLVVYSNGKELERMVGFKNAEAVEAVFKKYT